MSLKASVCLLSVLALTGCASTRGQVVREAVQLAPLTLPGDVKVRLGGTADGSPEVAFMIFEQTHPPGSALNNRALRRELAHSLLRQSDTHCEDYLARLSGGRRGMSATLGVASLLFSAVGAASTTVADATRWSAASTFAQSSDSELGQRIFAGREYSLIYAANRNGRKRTRTELLESVEGGKFDAWSLSSVFTLANAYHHECGLNYGLHQLASGG